MRAVEDDSLHVPFAHGKRNNRVGTRHRFGWVFYVSSSEGVRFSLSASWPKATIVTAILSAIDSASVGIAATHSMSLEDAQRRMFAKFDEDDAFSRPVSDSYTT